MARFRQPGIAFGSARIASIKADNCREQERIRQSMGLPRPVTARLAEPVPVLLTYQTAVVDDGVLRFVPDLYGQDALLEQALKQPRPQRLTSVKTTPTAPPPLHTRAGAAESIAAE